jgi:hypothetical protein
MIRLANFHIYFMSCNHITLHMIANNMLRISKIEINTDMFEINTDRWDLDIGQQCFTMP